MSSTSHGANSRFAERRFEAPESLTKGLSSLVGLGGLIFIIGLFVDPGRVWGGYLMGLVFLVGLALAGPIFLAFLKVAGARWSVSMQRVPEAMAAALPAAGIMGLGLIFGIHSLYEWAHPGVMEHDALLQLKAGWLNDMSFSLRLVLCFALWIVTARRLVEQSRRFAQEGDRQNRALLTSRSGQFVIVFAITFSVASYDWLMSLEPHWFSTMFPLYHLAGLASAGLAAVILLVLAMERQGALAGAVTDDQLHDLGKMLFSVTLIWAYCWYCQYMLIWYTDIPEETVYFASRQQGSWWLLVQASLFLGWAVPFVALMSRKSCRTRAVLSRVAMVVMVAHGLDLFIQVGPPLMGAEPVLGLWEIGPLVGSVSLFFLIVFKALGSVEAVPSSHPHLQDSLSYHTS